MPASCVPNIGNTCWPTVPNDKKEVAITRSAPSDAITHGNIRQGLVYVRVPHITLCSIANNAEVDVIWEKFQESLSACSGQL